jgi:hypothetical protein
MLTFVSTILCPDIQNRRQPFKTSFVSISFIKLNMIYMYIFALFSEVQNGCVALSIDSINQYMIYCVVKCNSVIDINHTYKWLFPPYNRGHQDDGKTHILL